MGELHTPNHNSRSSEGKVPLSGDDEEPALPAKRPQTTSFSLPGAQDESEVRVAHFGKSIVACEIVLAPDMWRRFSSLSESSQERVRGLLSQVKAVTEELPEKERKGKMVRLIWDLEDVSRDGKIEDLYRPFERFPIPLSEAVTRLPALLALPFVERECRTRLASDIAAELWQVPDDRLASLLQRLRRRGTSELLEAVVERFQIVSQDRVHPPSRELANALVKSCFVRKQFPFDVGNELQLVQEYTESSRTSIAYLVRDVARFDEKDRPLVVRGLLLGGFKVGDVKGILHAFRMLPENLKPKAELVSRAAGIVPDDMRSFFGDSVIDEAEGISASDRISVIHETLQKVGPSLLSRIPDQFWSEFQDSQLLIDLIDSHGVEGLDSALSRYEQLSSEVASRLVSAEKVNLVASHLPSFREVRPEVAEALTQSGFSHKVFEHFSRFDWDVPSCARFLNNLVSQDCALVLENLHRIPSHLLEGLEGENVFLERFKKDIGIGSERIYEMYRKRCMSGNPAKRREFVEAVSRLVEGMVSPKSHSDALISHPLYGELVNSVYTSHSGTFGPQELLDSPGGVRNVDRSGDIRRFAFDSKYTIDLAEGVRMVLRDGTSRATELMNAIQDPILFARGVAQNLTRVARGEPLQKAIAEEFSKLGPLPDGSSIEERLGLLLCNVVEGSSTKKQFMDCFLLHHMLVTSGELEFLRATQARSERAKNKDYAYLLLLREYFSDKLFDTAKNLFSEALKSSHVFERLATLHERVSGETLVKERRALMGRLQLSEAGMSQRVLDVIAEKLQDDRIPSAKKREIVSSIVSREQRRAAQLLRHLGEKPERPDAIHLGRFTDALPSLLSREAEIVPLESSGALDFFTSCFEGVVSPDIQSIDLEVKKYRVARGERRQARRVEAVFSKNQASLYARSVGGVCVASDGPEVVTGRRKRDLSFIFRNQSAGTQWELPNYFQLVLRDPESKRCEGVVLLHHYSDQGKRILTASFNPSNTYLLKVSEKQLFEGIMEVLTDFAKRNHFDLVACSKGRHIRTNRTGGEFEAAIDQRIASVGETFTLSRDEVFSYAPSYHQRALDALWIRRA